MGLAANIKDVMCVYGLLESTESAGIPMEVTQYELGSRWLECHVGEDGLNHVVGSRSCFTIVVGIGPTIEVVHQDGDLSVKLNGI